MREIKFRGKDILNGQWIKGYLFYDYNNADEYRPFITYKSEAFLGGVNERQIDEGTIGQYIGLRDESGKEIYEGDIVKFKHGDIIIMAPVKYGEWQESKCNEYYCSHYGYYIDYKWDNYCENTGFDLYEKIVEVVGNIYENPELLKGADNI